MNQDQPLRRLLDELQAADAERQGQPRDTPAYAEALNRVDRLMKAVWQGAGGVPSTPQPPGDYVPPEGSVTLGSPPSGDFPLALQPPTAGSSTP